MKVSIVIPVYNRATVVGRTLDSVLAQTHRPLQLVLVDNCSDDNTLQVLDDFKRAHTAADFEVLVVQEARHTAGAARNRGLEHATADWVMFFDSDDVMKPRLVERYVSRIEREGGEVDMVAARGRLVLPDGASRELPFYRRDIFARHILHGIIATQRYIVRRDFVNAADAWNIELPGWNDWEMGMRLLLARPRLAFLTCRPLIEVNHSGDDSITGTEFHSRAGQWERVIDIVENEVRCSMLKGRERYYRLLDYRRLVLAAHYEREGHPELAKPLCRAAYASLAQSYDNSRRWRWFVAPTVRRLFARIVAGKRGSAQVARLIF